jgi:hypothetical protein
MLIAKSHDHGVRNAVDQLRNAAKSVLNALDERDIDATARQLLDRICAALLPPVCMECLTFSTRRSSLRSAERINTQLPDLSR